MGKAWDGVLEVRQCQKPGCEKTFRCLPTSSNHFCSVTHQPDWFDLDFRWDETTLRGDLEQKRWARKG